MDQKIDIGEGVDSPVDQEDKQTHVVWQSCCLKVDADMVQFYVQTFIALLVLVFAGSQLIRYEVCEQIQPYISMITFIMGVYCKNPIKR